MASQAGHAVSVLEQQPPEASFGWGVVFWDDLLRQLDGHDLTTAETLRRHAYRWQDQVMTVNDEVLGRIRCFGFSMRRRLLLELLRGRAEAVGVRIVAQRFDGDLARCSEADLVIASDGVNSTIRRQQAQFGTRLTKRRNFYIWLGTDREFTSFTFPFVETESGWLWAHAYGFDHPASTFVVEMGPETWSSLGFGALSLDATLRKLEDLFATALDGHRLFPQAGSRESAPWANFLVVCNRHWHVDNVALMGDAAHTTHFTIGSGTRLAMEDAMALADALASRDTLADALSSYEATRQRQIRRVQLEATRSARWFEHVPRYIGHPQDFPTLLDDRRSPVMSALPVGAYLFLTRAFNRAPMIATPLRRLVSKF